MKCNLDYQSCNCEDCSKAKELYSELSFYEKDKEEYRHEISYITCKLESMGYTV